MVWKDFPVQYKNSNKVVWDLDSIRAIVDAFLHIASAKAIDRELWQNYLRDEASATAWVMNEATKNANKLTGKSPLLLMLMLGLENAPRNPNLTEHGALEEAAAQICEVNPQLMSRKFERPKSKLKRIIQKLNETTPERLEPSPSLAAPIKAVSQTVRKHPKTLGLTAERVKESRTERSRGNAKGRSSLPKSGSKK